MGTCLGMLYLNEFVHFLFALVKQYAEGALASDPLSSVGFPACVHMLISGKLHWIVAMG